MTALLLCIFLGGFGIHRFYVGKIETWRPSCWRYLAPKGWS
ncbi:MAG: TM2 domain-containing protein [Lachnospiraceae bacterium]|nr:TM2 domain-containing protein [Lachnospiraceae bacterium]